MIGVPVAEHDPAQSAELVRSPPDRSRHQLDAGIEGDDAVAVAQEVHVAVAWITLDPPQVVGDRLGVHATNLTAERGGR